MAEQRTRNLTVLMLVLLLVAVVSLSAAAYLLLSQTPATAEENETVASSDSREPAVTSATATIDATSNSSARVPATPFEVNVAPAREEPAEPPSFALPEPETIPTESPTIPVVIQVDGQTIQVASPGTNALDAVTAAGITLSATDVLSPGLETVLQAGDVVRVIRINEEERFEDETIPFQTVYQPSEDLDLDTKALLSSGVPGIKRKRFRAVYEDGIEVGEILVEEWIDQEPVNAVIGYGTRITTSTVDTAEGPREYWRVVRMRATAYTAASSGKSPDHPTYGITASGRPAGTGIVAVDTNVVPFRSEVFVPGYGVAFVGDTGGGVKGRWIDLGYDEHELVTWNNYVDVYYLTPIPAQINYLLPEILP